MQYRIGDDPTWTPWLTGTTKTRARFVGTIGYSYTFQVKATDNVGNVTHEWVESGPVQVEAVTRYYSFGGQRVAMRRGDEVRMRIFTETTWAPLP